MAVAPESADRTLERRYAAFISYRHLPGDRGWAKWLVDSLETFRTPRSLVRQGIPSRIGLLFRDEDENPVSAELADSIEKALLASAALIVTASRRTPESRWIDREVQRFQQLGRGDRILVLLTDGEPAEAYPPSLLRDADREPIAADVRPRRDESQRLLKHRARLRLAAALLGCSFDDLYRRDAKRRRRRLAAAASLLLAVAVAGAALYVLGEQAQERLRLDRVALGIREDPDFSLRDDENAAAMFSALSKRAWPFATLPPNARELLGSSLRKGAVSQVAFPAGRTPIVVEPWGMAGVLAGHADGSVFAYEESAKGVLGSGGCAGRDLAFMRCAITALDASRQEATAGSNRGEVILFDPLGRSQPYRVSPTTLRIEALASLPGGGAIAADARGSLHRVARDKGSALVSTGGGSVARLLWEPDGGLLVVRVNGRIERLRRDGQLATVVKVNGPVRSAGFVAGKFYLALTGGELGRKHLLEGPVERPKVLPDSGRMYIESSREGVFFGLRDREIAVGKGTDIRMFDVAARSFGRIGIERPTFEEEAREIAFSFYGSIAASRDGRRLFSIDLAKNALLLIDLDELGRIDATLRNSRNPRRDLCRPRMAKAFAHLGLPRSACA